MEGGIKMELNNSGTIVRNRIKYTGGGSGSSKAVSMTEAEYEALVAENKDDPNIPYYITDGESSEEENGGGTAATTTFDDTETQLGVDNVQDAIVAVFQSASNGKQVIADALTGMGLETSADLSFTELANRITEKLFYPVEKSITGTFTATIANYNGAAYNVSFGVTFKEPPSVIANIPSGHFKDVSVSNITTIGCTVSWGSNVRESSATCTWTATGKVLE